MKAPKRLTIISLCCFCAPFVFQVFAYNFLRLFSGFRTIISAFANAYSIVQKLGPFAMLAGVILIIICIAKYPDYRKAKIILVVYIALIAIGLVALLLITLVLGKLVSNCGG